MKKSLIIMSAAALALAAACSSEEPSTNGDGGIDNTTAYLNVQIAMTSTSGSRAATDVGYVNGTTAEGAVKTADFYLYDASGNYLAHSKVNPLPTGTAQADGSNVETTEDAVVPFGPMTITAGSDIYMITILNMSVDGSAFTSTLSTALEALASETLPKDAGSFEMSSSAYNNGNSDLRYNVVPASKFKTSSDDAKEDPVEVYVERTVARVDIAYENNIEGTTIYKIGDGSNDVQVVLDGTTYDGLAVKVLGQKVNITNKSGYMIKNINSSTTYYYLTGTKGTDLAATTWSKANWSKSGDSRSYWAEDANYQTTKNADFNIYSFNDINGQTAASEYVFENTVDHSVTGSAAEAVAEYARYAPGEDATNVTTLCVVGQLGYYDGSSFKALWSDDTKDGTLYRINGMFYTEDYLKGLLASALSTSYNKDGNALSASDIALSLKDATATSNRADIGVRTLVVKPNGVTILDANGNSVSTLELTGTPYAGDVDVFLNGYCYYQVPIEQALDSSSTGTLYGVVRNHVYAITVNGVNKIGNPVYDPDKPLTPIPGDEQYYYLAAQINVLAWRKVTQSVTL